MRRPGERPSPSRTRPAHQGFGSLGHLAVRFVGSLGTGGPPPVDEQWAMGRLLPGEQELWVRMSGPDRRHAVRVAQDTVADLRSGDLAPEGEAATGRSDDDGPVCNGPVDRSIVAAALMHDVGKIQSGLGTWARVAVTVVSMVVGRSRVASWNPESPSPRPGSTGLGPSGSDPAPVRRSGPGPFGAVRAAAGRYVTHDRIGGDLLLAAGSDPLTVAWATEHHLPETAWTLDARTAAALKAADGD